MLITLKSPREINLMRDAGQLVARAHGIAAGMMQPGVTTREIDAAIERLFAEHQAIPLFKNFPGKVPFPAVTCISVNEQIVHGIPGDYRLQLGDIVSVDTGCKLHGWCGDAAWSYAVGEVDEASRKLLDAGRDTLQTAILGLGECRRWSEVSTRMAALVRSRGFSVVEQFVGHGIGREMHEPPQVPNYFNSSVKKDDFDIRPGLVLAVEPMINAGKKGSKVLRDHWTAVTQDKKRSVHFEHTIAVTKDGPVLLTAGVGTPLRTK